MAGLITEECGLAKDIDVRGRWKVSASQVRTYSECPRKWGFRYIDGHQSPQSPAAALGSAVHKCLEQKLGGEAAGVFEGRAWQIASSGLDLYPDEVDMVEPQIMFSVDDVLFRGYVDAIWLDETETVVICDHKTSSNPKKWGLTEKTLPDDVQALIYGVWGLDYYTDDTVGLQWTYYATRGAPNPYAVKTTLERESARHKFRTVVLPIAKKIVDAVKNVEAASELDPEPSACGNYGGCPFAEFCHLSADQRLKAAFKDEEKEETMGLRDRIKKQAPPKPEQIAAGINPPEKPTSVDVSRVISRAVAVVTGNAAKKKEKARALAEACAGVTSEDEAKAKCLELLKGWGDVEDKSAPKPEPAPTAAVPDPSRRKSPTQDEILAMVGTGTVSFTSNKADATVAYAHGRTLAAMKRNGLIDFEKEGSIYSVSLTERMRERLETAKEAARDEMLAEAKPADEAPTQTPDPVEILEKVDEISASYEERQAFLMLLGTTQNVDKANELFDAYLARFSA